MTLLPIVVRELRVASRRRVTYWVRSGAALVLIIIGVMLDASMARDWRSTPQGRSQVLFGFLTGAAVMYALISGVRDTADCLSSEKRNGTLGLLFLTDLKGYDVVLGKLAANSLNAFYSIVAIVPLLAVPLLMGGVTPGEFGRAALVVLNTMFFSLSAGMVVSALSRSMQRAIGGTFLLILTVTALIPALGAALYLFDRTFPFVRAFLLCSPGYTYFLAWDRNYKLYRDQYWLSLGIVHALGWFCLALASFLAPRSWQDRPGSAREVRWRDRSKIWKHGSFSQRRDYRKRLLDANAFFWLAARDRLKPMYVWFVFALLGCGWLWGYYKLKSDWLNPPVMFATAILLNIIVKSWFAAECGRQLAEDRKQGALELLLSTPLTARDILRGQQLALQRQFLAPVITVLLIAMLLMLKSRRDLMESEDAGTEFYLFWIGGMVMLVADLTALFYDGQWQAMTAKNPSRSSSVSAARILVLPGIAWAGISFLAILSSDRGRAQPGPTFFLGLWFALGLAADFVFGMTARQKFLAEFRLAAERPTALQTGFLRRWMDGGAG